MLLMVDSQDKFHEELPYNRIRERWDCRLSAARFWPVGMIGLIYLMLLINLDFH